MRLRHLATSALSLFALASSATAGSTDTTSVLSVELAGDYKEVTDVLVTFHDAKGTVIGKCAAEEATIEAGSKGAADSMTMPCVPYDPFLIDTEFILMDFEEGVEAFLVDSVDTTSIRGGAGLYLELDNVTVTHFEDLWPLAGYDLDELGDIDWGGLSKGGTGFFSIKKSKT
jgi:hypothetical protein